MIGRVVEWHVRFKGKGGASPCIDHLTLVPKRDVTQIGAKSQLGAPTTPLIRTRDAAHRTPFHPLHPPVSEMYGWIYRIREFH